YKPKIMNPELIGFLYKQYAQSSIRQSLDSLYFGEKKLEEIDIKQNLLIKRGIGTSFKEVLL
ncbi:hypothetical protein BpHYR1_006780, partial [Brachionus plicatilis]